MKQQPKHNPFEIDMSAERNGRSYRGESGYSILDAANINDEAYGVGDGSNDRSNDGDDDGNNPGYPREPMNDQTTRNHFPPRHSRMRKVLGIGGLLGLLYVGGLTNAHKAIGSGCSYAYQGTKSVIADPFTTTPEELVEEVQSIFQRYQQEIESGSYARELKQLTSIVDQHITPEAKLKNLGSQFAGRSLEATLNRLSERNNRDQQKMDYLAVDVIETLQSYLSTDQKKKFAQQTLANLASAFTAEESQQLIRALGDGSPERLYKMGIQAIILAKKNYAAIQELAKELTPQQRQSLAMLPTTVTPTGYTPAKAGVQVSPVSKPAPASITSASKPVVPISKPTAKTESPLEKAQQRARQFKPEG